MWIKNFFWPIFFIFLFFLYCSIIEADFSLEFRDNRLRTSDWQAPFFVSWPTFVDENNVVLNQSLVSSASAFQIGDFELSDNNNNQAVVVNQFLYLFNNQIKTLIDIDDLKHPFPLSSGYYQLETTLKDGVNNFSDTHILDLLVDQQPPEVSLDFSIERFVDNPFVIPFTTKDNFSLVKGVELQYRFRNKDQLDFSQWIDYQTKVINEATYSGQFIFEITNDDNFINYGDYQFSLLASDQLNNYSESILSAVVEVDLRVDNISQVQVLENGFLRNFNEKIANSKFQNGWDNWQVGGDVAILENYDEENQGYFFGKKSVRIGNSHDNGLLGANFLQQTINNVDKTATLYFQYNVISQETLLGFDVPAFRVLINNKVVFEVDAVSASYPTNLEGFLATTWTDVFINLSDFNDQFLTLRFEAGNSNDNLANSFVYIHSLSTDKLVLNSDNYLYISGENSNDEITLSYHDGIDKNDINQITPLTYQFNGLYFIQNFDYFLHNSTRTTQSQNMLFYNYRGAPNKISHLEVFYEQDGEYLFSFNRVEYNVKNINIYHSQEPIAQNTNFSQLNLVAISDFNLLNSFGQMPMHFLPLDYLLGVSLNEKSYYFVVQNCDLVNNCSLFSNQFFCQEGVCRDLGPVESQKLVINEVQYNPLGSDVGVMPNGEWIEIYNDSDQTTDLADYYFKNDRNWTLKITSINSDNDNNFNDQGETVILPFSYLVIYRNASAFFSNNDEVVSFYNKDNQLLDKFSYQGYKKEGYSVGRFKDDQNKLFSNLKPSPLLSNQFNLN